MSAVETTFLYQVRAYKLPTPDREYLAIPGRKFRFDFAWVDQRILVEIQGGTWSMQRTGHSSGAGIKRDCIKSNEAQKHGWTLFKFTSDMVNDGSAILWIAPILQIREAR